MRGLGLGLGLSLGSGGGSSAPPTPPTGSVMWVNADQQALGATQTWTDLSGSGHAPIQNSAPFRPVNTASVGPKAGSNGMVFTSASSTQMSLAAALIGTVNYTIAIVAKVTSTGAAQSFIACGNSVANGLLVGVDLSATAKRDFLAAGVASISDTTAVATTNWEAWVFNSDASGNLSLLVNGASQTLSSTSVTLGSPSAATGIGNTAGTRLLNGILSEIIVWNTMQNAATVAAYQRANTGLW